LSTSCLKNDYRYRPAGPEHSTGRDAAVLAFLGDLRSLMHRLMTTVFYATSKLLIVLHRAPRSHNFSFSPARKDLLKRKAGARWMLTTNKALGRNIPTNRYAAEIGASQAAYSTLWNGRGLIGA